MSFKKIFISLFERVREHKQGVGAEGKGEGEAQADSELRVEPNMRVDLMAPRSPLEWKPRVICSTDCVTQVP